MKRLSIAIIFLVSLFTISSYAGAPQEQPLQGQGNYFYGTIKGSTSTLTNANAQISIAVAPPSTPTNGNAFQNCFTKFVIQLSTGAIFSVYDGAVSTNAVQALNIYGAGLGNGAQAVNTLALPEDHLGPLCMSAGVTTNLVITTGTVAGISGVGMTINYEGYTTNGSGSSQNRGGNN